MVLSALGWIVLGLIAGLIASQLVIKRSEKLPFDILLGAVGAVIGGWLFDVAGITGLTGFNVWSLLVAVFGAVIFLVAWHTIRRSVWHA